MLFSVFGRPRIDRGVPFLPLCYLVSVETTLLFDIPVHAAEYPCWLQT